MITYLNTRHDPYYGMHFQEMSIRILAQFFGGLWGYSINQTVWNLYLTPNHWYQSYNTSFGNCWTFLTVDTTTGFFIGIIEAQIFYLKKKSYLEINWGIAHCDVFYPGKNPSN